MTDDEKIDHIYRYLFEPPGPGKPVRAESLDKLLDGVRTGKLTVRAFLWFCGAFVAVGAVVTMIRGWLP